MTLRTLSLLFFTLVALAAGCAGSTERASEFRQRRHRAHVEHERAEAKAVRINRTLLYDVQWSRADDLAESIAPIVQNLYGSGAQVIPHRQTNKLFIYIPPHRDREHGTGGGSGRAITGSTRSGIPRVGDSRTTGGRSSRSSSARGLR